ncbi:zinc finger FYVE domain-containing protein 9 [Corythoichthys intestinalis]|uniref:zinc finger FYVE domain-containing protein 9 n=1 Tax=Corythoichthys intestinalis TaxID=161448 RepID=UPI0025A5BA81|nr:zinc finger FYVE domain-containing protein 9 [Corythoichthys intestinalis]XP_061790651.1 zinc finger FYVE domain-containing protein 9-like [Nerophis lumbriciformis]
MLKLFSARDDDNESLLGGVTEDEGDNPSLCDTKLPWMSRPYLLVLKDAGDMSKSGQIRPEVSPSKPFSDKTVTPSVEKPPAKMLNVEEGGCKVTPWVEGQGEESPSPLVLSLAEEEGKLKTVPSKEDSVIEEKEMEESEDFQNHLKDVLSIGEEEGKASTSSPVNPDNESGPVGIMSKERSDALGEVAPVWIPDAEAHVCMKCGIKFTFTKRRHHCRACGKVFCALCSGLKFRLSHLDGKEGRVCVSCHSTLIKSTSPRVRRRVWFADELLIQKQSESAPATPVRGPALPPLRSRAARSGTVKSPGGSPQLRRASRPHGGANEACAARNWGTSTLVSSSSNLIPLEGLPPILTSTGVKGDYTVEEQPSETLLIHELESGRSNPLVFVLNANLLAMVKMVNYVNRKCWCVTTKGMHAVGQVEVMVLLQCLPEEKSFPSDIFNHFIQLYKDSLTGKVIKHLSLSLSTGCFLGSDEHAGFLFVRPTRQSLQGLPLPSQPYLFGLLLHRAEVVWAKMFPLRLMLRLGAEYRFYPCPLYSVRFRKPLFGDVGHTVMRLLVDFRNFRYSLPMVQGLTMDLEAQKTCIKIPTTGYNELMKAMNKCNEHVLAMGACFNEEADSHLICVQKDDGQYQTQAISIHNQPRKVTGSCFFIFSSALKATAGYFAKSSIVEDGLMVQITPETMAELRRSLREMKDYVVTCGRVDRADSQELVCVQWVEAKCLLNKGVVSPIDGKSMESISSTKMFQKSEYKENGKIIHWTEVFYLQRAEPPKGIAANAPEHNRLTERIARAFCLALCPYLKLLKEDGMAKLGLRVTFDPQQVGFVAGSNGHPLPPQYLNALDTTLIPVIHSRGRKRGDEPVVMELIFYILEYIT